MSHVAVVPFSVVIIIVDDLYIDENASLHNTIRASVDAGKRPFNHT